MPVIKRYPNRKLYDTEAKTYVTLDEITEMIRAGRDVQVIDHETGDDLTTLTLSQIILEQEKKSAGFLPRSLLTSLIRTGGDTLEQVLRTFHGGSEDDEAFAAQPTAAADAAKERNILAIGNVIDTQADYPDTVVASALWHFEPTLDKAIAEVMAGSFKAADYGVYSFMKEGGCSLAPLGTFEGKVPADVMALVAEKEAAIKDGSFTVEINDEEPKSS